MNVIQALITGAGRVPSIWKSIIFSWFATLLLVAAMVIPLKGALSTGFGSSMITEKLTEGFNLSVLTDMDSFRSIMGGLSSGMFFMILAGFILNAFLTGGFFSSLKEEADGSSIGAFMKGCAGNFWSYVIILLLTGIIILFSALLTGFLPIVFIDMEGDHVEKSVITAAIISSLVFFVIILPVMLLVADYARAWKAANSRGGAFRAIGKGFGLTFGNFVPSWATMMILLILNAIYLWLAFSVIPGMSASTGMGVFLLFILSQAMFIFRLSLKAYRYSSITALLEQTRSKENTPVI